VQVCTELGDANKILTAMNKKERKLYIKARVKNKIYSKLRFHEDQVQYYYKYRHKGLAGLDTEQVKGLVEKSIRDLRIWKEINRLIPRIAMM
tara:strand:- start:122 stop:397 length:276 start_codon:yes stop_codon:yes gene_type:complete